jgi:hypothetical protein
MHFPKSADVAHLAPTTGLIWQGSGCSSGESCGLDITATTARLRMRRTVANFILSYLIKRIGVEFSSIQNLADKLWQTNKKIMVDLVKIFSNCYIISINILQHIASIIDFST